MNRSFVFAFALTVLVAPSALAEPTVKQCLASNERSIQLRSDHKLRDARAELMQCATAACPAEVRGECERRLNAVVGEIPTVVLGAKDRRGNDLVDVRAFIDGALVTPKLDGTPLELDPGPHVFRFEATAQPAVEKQVVVREGEKDRAIRVTIGKPEPAATAVSRRDPTMRTAGVALASVGLAGIVVGSVFGGLASSAWSRSQEKCSTKGCTDPGGAITDHDTAVTFATVSTISFIAGGVALAGGAAMFFFAPVVKPQTVGMTFALRF